MINFIMSLWSFSRRFIGNIVVLAAIAFIVLTCIALSFNLIAGLVVGLVGLTCVATLFGYQRYTQSCNKKNLQNLEEIKNDVSEINESTNTIIADLDKSIEVTKTAHDELMEETREKVARTKENIEVFDKANKAFRVAIGEHHRESETEAKKAEVLKERTEELISAGIEKRTNDAAAVSQTCEKIESVLLECKELEPLPELSLDMDARMDAIYQQNNRQIEDTASFLAEMDAFLAEPRLDQEIASSAPAVAASA